jgi:hypothetical protein
MRFSPTLVGHDTAVARCAGQYPRLKEIERTGLTNTPS